MWISELCSDVRRSVEPRTLCEASRTDRPRDSSRTPRSPPMPTISRRDASRAARPADSAVSRCSACSPPSLPAPKRTANPLAPKLPHFPARAKRVIFLFMHGGVSHVDTFDPKPKLAEMNGKPLPFAKPKFEFAPTGNLLASPWKFQQARPERHRSQRAVSRTSAALHRRHLRHPLDERRQPGLARAGAAAR